MPAPAPATVFMPAPVDRSAWRLSIAVVLALMVARLLALLVNRTDLFVDEAQYWVWSEALDWGYYSKPPLIALVIRATTTLFGDGEAAVRAAAPVFHAATALVVGALANRLHGGRAGALASLVYATLPAVALSSTLISTDVPLLLFWSFGLLAAVRHAESGGLRSAAALGAAVAVGLNAKYAMGYIVPVVILAYATAPVLRSRLRGWRLWSGLCVGLLGLVPNLLWNAAHDWVTFRHTGDNAAWGRHLLDLNSLGEFLGTQVGVFGPLPMALLLGAAIGRVATARRPADRFLLAASLPVLATIAVQALIAEANANWAATAYPAGAALVGALLADLGRPLVTRLTIGTGAIVSAVLLIAPAAAPDLRLPGLGRPFERVLGWRDFAEAVAAEADRRGVRTLVPHRRADAAELLYQLRGRGFAVAVPVQPGALPRDHFQMTVPFTTALPAPGLSIAEGDAEPPPGAVMAGESIRLPVGRGVAKSRGMTLQPVDW